MSEVPEDALSRRERQFMDIVYRHEEVTAALVEAELDDGTSNTTVRAILRILEEKGHLKHRREGKTFVYSPCRPREAAGRSALKRVLSTFFEGSLEKAVAAHLTDDASDLSPEELVRLAKLIRQARKEGS